jgi:hypothetical protein
MYGGRREDLIMYNIINQCIEMEKQTAVSKHGEIISMKATHLLLNHTHYKQILKSIGINSENLPSPIEELYGLKIVFTATPLDSPRVLSLS